MYKPVADFIHQTIGSANCVVIFGLGREGHSTYKVIRQVLPSLKIILIDDQPLDKLPAHWARIIEQELMTEFIESQAALELDLSQALVFQTPGIPLSHPLRQHLVAEDTRITSNTQLLFDIVHAVYPAIKVIGVTGTKGKSTTTSVLYHLLQTAQLPCWLGGNIGKPALDVLTQLPSTTHEHGYIVLELSSHQLDLMHSSPDIAIVQNIVPEHLDYYQTFDRYQAAKSHITQFQTPEDWVIFNPAFTTSSAVAAQSVGKKLTFTTGELPSQPVAHHVTASIEADKIVIHSHSENKATFLLNSDEIALKGKHNLENILPSVVVGEALHLPHEIIAEALRSFRGLPHRLEHVATVNGVEYYNDSLATVPDATVAALEAFPNQPIILIAGGYDRGVGVTQLAEYLLEHPVKALLLFPTTGTQLAAKIEALRQAGGEESLPVFSVHPISTMREAVTTASHLAQDGDIVLLSPAAASFNLFRDYQDRGDQFRRAVQGLPINK